MPRCEYPLCEAEGRRMKVTVLARDLVTTIVLCDEHIAAVRVELPK